MLFYLFNALDSGLHSCQQAALGNSLLSFVLQHVQERPQQGGRIPCQAVTSRRQQAKEVKEKPPIPLRKRQTTLQDE